LAKDRIGVAHPPNQIPQFPPNRGPTLSPPTLPRPVASEPLPVPAHHGRWPHHTQRILPVLPEPRQHHPGDPIQSRQPRPRLTRFPQGELLPQRQVLQRQLPLRANSASHCPKKDAQPSDHYRSNSGSVRKRQDSCDGRVIRRDSLSPHPSFSETGDRGRPLGFNVFAHDPGTDAVQWTEDAPKPAVAYFTRHWSRCYACGSRT